MFEGLKLGKVLGTGTCQNREIIHIERTERIEKKQKKTFQVFEALAEPL